MTDSVRPTMFTFAAMSKPMPVATGVVGCALDVQLKTPQTTC